MSKEINAPGPVCRHEHEVKLRLFLRKVVFCALLGSVLVSALLSESRAQFTPGPEYFNQPGLATVNALPAYQQGITGAGVLIGVIDTGITPNHVAFNGAIVSGIGWRRTDSELNADNWVPYFVSKSANNLNLLTDLNTDGTTGGHGTFVSSLAAGRTDMSNRSASMLGVAFNSNITVGTIYFNKEENKVITQQGLSDEQFAKTIRYVADQGARVINNSWGSAPSWALSMTDSAEAFRKEAPLVTEAFKYALDKGAVIVVAAGNESIGWPGPPATLPSVDASIRNKGGWIVVAATTNRGVNPDTNTIEMAQTRQNLSAPADENDYYTNYCGAAKLYCISAPGGLNGVSDEVTIRDRGMMGAKAPTTNGYDFGNGTSYAAPIVAGAVALVAEVFPWMTNKNLATTILTTGTSAETPSEVWGRGLLDIGRAIQGPGIFEETFDANVTAGYRSAFSNNISGIAGLDKRGAGTLIMRGTNTYTGDTGVYGGTLQVTGSIAPSTVTVYREGLLTGTGVVGPTIVSGIIAPGNSPGTLTIAGNYLQQAGGIYQYEIDAQGKTDLLNVQGVATIEPGAVLLMMNPLRLRLNTGYSLITATGGIVGKDNYVTPAYLLMNQNYSISAPSAASTLQYTLTRNNTPIAFFGETTNQRSVANAMDSLQSGHLLFNQLMLTTDASSLPATLNGLSGEIYSSTLSALMNQSTLLLQPVTGRLQSALNPQALPNGAQTVREDGPDKAVWGQALGGWGKLPAAGVAQGVNSSMGGLLVGSDVALTPHTRVGVSAGATSTRVSNADGASNTMGYHLLAYGGMQGELFGLRGGLGQSWYSIAANRTLSYDYGGLTGYTNANSTQLFLETDVTYQVGNTNLRPFVGVTQLWMRANAFSETETNFIRLSANSSQNNVTFATLGLRADRVFETAASQLRVNGMVGWRNASGAVAPNTTMQLDVANPFTISGAPIARNALVMELAVSAQVAQSTTVNLSYGGQFGSGMQSNTIQAGLVFNF